MGLRLRKVLFLMLSPISSCHSEYSCVKKPWFRRSGNQHSGHGNHLWLAWLPIIRNRANVKPEPLCGALAGFSLVRFLVFYILANRFPNHRTAWTSKPEYSATDWTRLAESTSRRSISHSLHRCDPLLRKGQQRNPKARSLHNSGN